MALLNCNRRGIVVPIGLAAMILSFCHCEPLPARDAGADATDVRSDVDAGSPDTGYHAGVTGADRWIRYCALSMACAPLVNPPAGTVSTCAAQVEIALDLGIPLLPRSSMLDALECAERSPDCQAFARCVSRDHGLSYCSARPGATCDGKLLVACPAAPVTHPAPVYVVDCEASGLDCREAGDAAVCTNGRTCDPLESGCVGSTLYGCNAATHLQWQFDCGLMDEGAACVEIAGIGYCAPSTTVCTGTEPLCQGDSYVGCSFPTHRRFAINCSEHGSHCTAAGCVPNASDCVAAVEGCRGSSLHACVDGVLHSLDCRTLGFATCSSINGRPVCTD